jgi:hypothetical protein
VQLTCVNGGVVVIQFCRRVPHTEEWVQSTK